MSEETNEDAIADEVVSRRRGRPPLPTRQANDESTDGQADEPAPSASKIKRFPVKLLRNYRPHNDFLVDGVPATEEQRQKVPAGVSIEIDINEAKDMMAKGLAVRDDPID